MNADEAGSKLNERLREAGLESLDNETASRFDLYLSLFIRWNQRLNLISVRDEEAIIERHLIESITVARSLPDGISSLLDFGAGGGLPGIPIALCRPEVAVTLAESQGKKAAFLMEAVRTLGISVTVHAQRAETLGTVFDCVILRAVDKMPKAVAAAAPLIAPGGWLALMTTHATITAIQPAAGRGFSWSPPILLPWSESRLLALGQRISSRA
jgi:16S rRNA (guanine527-N7)-methyltransferase